MTCRYYIASPDYLQAEALLGPEAALERVGSGSDGRRALLDTLALTPDLLLLDAALPGLDGLALLCRLQKETITPPRVLFLARTPESAAASEILRERADARLAWPGQADALLPAALSAARASVPLLARPHEGLRLSLADALLDRLEVPETLKGRRYMQYAAAQAAAAPQLLLSCQQALYPLLARRFCAGIPAVEKAIRTAVEHTWLRGDLNAIQALFGFSVDAERGKPTNKEFISMLAEHVRRKAARQWIGGAADDEYFSG